jgi:hypothetical protein
MSTFKRHLTIWVGLCIIVGIALGHFFPTVFHIGSAEIAKVNLPVAVLIWLMIIPMLVKIDFAALSQVKEHWRGIGIALLVNRTVKPFSMALLGCTSSAGCSEPICRHTRSTATSRGWYEAGATVSSESQARKQEVERWMSSSITIPNVGRLETFSRS